MLAFGPAALPMPDGLDATAQFGYSVALNERFAVVGAPTQANKGAVYVYERQSDGSWELDGELVSADPTDEDYFGRAVDVGHGQLQNTIVVGAPLSDIHGVDAGAAFVYTRDQFGRWQLEDIPWEVSPDHRIGVSVSISEDTIAVGAPRKKPATDESGSVHLYSKLENEWRHEREISAGSIEGVTGIGFGTSVAVDDRVLVIGTKQENVPAVVYNLPAVDDIVDEEPVARQLVASVNDETAVCSGSKVAISYPNIVVGQCDGRAVIHHAKNVAVPPIPLTGPGASNSFGQAVAIDRNTILVGAPEAGSEHLGVVHVFEKDGKGNWKRDQDALTSAYSRRNQQFGSALAIQGGLSLVGSNNPLAARASAEAFLDLDGFGPTAGADLEISVKVDDKSVLGEVVSYEVTVRNHGPDLAENVRILTSFPSFLTPTADTECNGGVWTPPICTLPNLADGASVNFKIEFAVDLDEDSMAALPASATVHFALLADSFDSNPKNNFLDAGYTTPLGLKADLSVAVVEPTVAERIEEESGVLSFVIVVTNNGPSPASGAVVEFTLTPDMSTQLSANGIELEENPDGARVIPNLELNKSVQIRADVSVAAETSEFSYDARVRFAGDDDTDNTARGDVAINAPPIAGDDSFQGFVGQRITGTLGGNDRDPDGGVIAVVDPVTGKAATGAITVTTDNGSVRNQSGWNVHLQPGCGPRG